MSNLIKSRYVYVNGIEKKIIDSNGKVEEFRTVNITKPLGGLLSKEDNVNADKSEEDIFTEGIKATTVTKGLSDEDLQTLQEQADQIILEAESKAARTIDEAKQNASQMSEQICEEARKRGYSEGLLKAETEVNQAKKDLEGLIQQHNLDYQKQIENLEPQFADIMTKLVEKITGVVVEENYDVILYLIHNAMVKVDNSKSYTIRTSKDDYEFILSKKEELNNLIKGETTIDITLDSNLNKNQCLIETDSRIIDCSLDVQLKNLVQNIKLLSIQKD